MSNELTCKKFMDTTAILSPDIIARLKRIQFRMRSLATDVFSGQYESAFKGRGIEFEEVRPYQEGDEIRTIDWNVTARTGQPFVKVFREERELTILFLVDVSASMGFGTTDHRKADIAAEVTALLAYAALKNHDKIGLMLFSDHVEKYIPAKKGRGHIWRVIREILSHKSHEGRTNLALPLNFLNQIAKRRVVVFLISDFLGNRDQSFTLSLRRAARHHDLTSISIHDQRESSLPDVRWIELKDAETGDRRLVNAANPSIRKNWQESWDRDRQELQKLFQSVGMDQITLDTEGNYVNPLIRFFRARERRFH